jgi:hypothetical protein
LPALASAATVLATGSFHTVGDGVAMQRLAGESAGRIACRMSHKALPGFRDFYPAEFAVRAHITTPGAASCARYAFTEYDGPPLEPLELYTQKSGEEIVGQLYNFEDKGGRAVAMRPR